MYIRDTQRQNADCDVTENISYILKGAVNSKWQGGQQFQGHMQNVQYYSENRMCMIKMICFYILKNTIMVMIIKTMWKKDDFI